MLAINYLLNLGGMAMLAGAAFNWLRWRAGNQSAGIRARSLAVGGAMLLVFGSLVSPIESKVVQPVNGTAPVVQTQPAPAQPEAPAQPAPAQPEASGQPAK